MAQINLREYYPEFYKTDTIIEAPEEVLAIMQEAKRKEAAYRRKQYRYKAIYSLNCGDGIEAYALFATLTPEDIFAQQEQLEQLNRAIESLPEKQARRIRAHYFHGMTITEIAAIEGVHKSQITRSIGRGLAGIALYLKNF